MPSPENRSFPRETSPRRRAREGNWYARANLFFYSHFRHVADEGRSFFSRLSVVSFRRRFSRVRCFALLRGTSAHISARTSFVDAFLSRKSPFRGRVRARGCVFRAQGSLSINLSLFSLLREREKKGRFLKERIGGKRLLPDDDGRFERRAFM